MSVSDLTREKRPGGVDLACARFDGVKKRFGKWGNKKKCDPEVVANGTSGLVLSLLTVCFCGKTAIDYAQYHAGRATRP